MPAVCLRLLVLECLCATICLITDLSICTHTLAGMTASAMLVMRKRKIDEANRNVKAEAEVVGIKSDPDVEFHTSCLSFSTIAC